MNVCYFAALQGRRTTHIYFIHKYAEEIRAK